MIRNYILSRVAKTLVVNIEDEFELNEVVICFRIAYRGFTSKMRTLHVGENRIEIFTNEKEFCEVANTMDKLHIKYEWRF